jgi:predicted nucleic acid-binding protein
MILVDTDVLSAFAKIDAIHLLFELFKVDFMSITEGVFKEIRYSADAGYGFAELLIRLVDSQKLQIVHLTAQEKVEAEKLPNSLGVGERESIVALKNRGGILLSNESRVRHYCQYWHLVSLRIPDILRALWIEKVVSKQEVMRIIQELGSRDQMRFSESSIQAIFAEAP